MSSGEDIDDFDNGIQVPIVQNSLFGTDDPAI
jgi:hypothetical protein